MQIFGKNASESLQVDTLVPPDDSSEPEAATLAREIRHIATDGSQQSDSRLIALLSNASFMNGSSLERIPNIWGILENIHRASPIPNSPPSHLHPSTTSSPTRVGSEPHLLKGDESTTSSSNIYPYQLPNESSSSVEFSDTSSIMLYSPLFPTQSDIVELGELVPYDSDSGEVDERDVLVNPGDDRVRKEVVDNTQDVVVGRSSWTLKWPFLIWHRQNQTQQGISQTLSSSSGSGGPQQQSAEFTSSQVGTNNVDTDSPTTQRDRTAKSKRSRRAWVPSSSKLSIQVFWWGYCLYFPPPILEILSDKSLEAAKRAAMISASLSWFFDHMPISIIPLYLKSGLMILQRLIPLIDCIGLFISWGWGTIMSYDVGYGVTLTATWVLPVPLIPGTWHERDFPKSPLPNSPIPLPPSHPFSMQSFEPPTPTMSTMSTTDDDIPTSAYATPMSSAMINSSPLPVPDALDENREVDLSLVSSSTASSASPPPPQLPPHLHISPPTQYPIPNSPDSLCFTPNSPTAAAAATPIAYRCLQPLPSASTSFVPFTTLNPSTTTTLPSPRIRTPRFSTRMGSFSPSKTRNNSGINANPPPPLPITPVSTSTPIPMPPTPIDLLPIPPELPLSPIQVNQLLRAPAFQTVPLPDVDDDGNNGDDVGGVGVGVGVGADLVDKSLRRSRPSSVVGRTRNNLKGKKMETNNAV